MTHPLVQVARQCLAERLGGTSPKPVPGADRGGKPQACFVSLKIKGRLRGCMGTLTPVKPTLEEEVRANTLAAALRDPRFEPVRPEEIPAISISIDLLSPLERIESERELDPKKYGVVVRSGDKAGTLLPDLPGVTTPQRQIEICKEKADIPLHESVTLDRFTVERIEE